MCEVLLGGIQTLDLSCHLRDVALGLGCSSLYIRDLGEHIVEFCLGGLDALYRLGIRGALALDLSPNRSVEVILMILKGS